MKRTKVLHYECINSFDIFIKGYIYYFICIYYDVFTNKHHLIFIYTDKACVLQKSFSSDSEANKWFEDILINFKEIRIESDLMDTDLHNLLFKND